MRDHSVIDLDQLNSVKIFTQFETKTLIHNYLVRKGKLIPILTRKYFVEKYNLYDLYYSILHHTRLFHNITFIERIYRIYTSNYAPVICKYCHTKNVNFDKFTTGFRDFCSISCSTSYNTPSKFLPPPTKLRISANISQKRKGMTFSKEWKANLKKSACSIEVINKKKKTCKERYGTENPGVLGAYNSKSATEYIQQLLIERKIDPLRAWYKDKSNNKVEFWQMIDVPFLGKMKYFSYDLIVFSSIEASLKKDLNEIELVFEYNGPWHYQINELTGCEHEPASPYKTNKFTKNEQFILDDIKINHIKKFNPKEILIYWWKSDSLIRIPVN